MRLSRIGDDFRGYSAYYGQAHAPEPRCNVRPTGRLSDSGSGRGRHRASRASRQDAKTQRRLQRRLEPDEVRREKKGVVTASPAITAAAVRSRGASHGAAPREAA